MIKSRVPRSVAAACLAFLIAASHAGAAGQGKSPGDRLKAAATRSMAGTGQTWRNGAPAVPGFEARSFMAHGAVAKNGTGSNDTLYFLSLVPSWVELEGSGGPDFLLPVVIDEENVAFVIAFGSELIWFQGGAEPLVLPDTGLEPPLRLLVADVLPAAGNELLVAGGTGMVAGSLPPAAWTPVGADAPGRIDAIIAIPEADGLLLIGAINGDLWAYETDTASWQPGPTFPGQPAQVLALTAPFLEHSLLLAWDGSALQSLRVDHEGKGEPGLVWKPFPAQPSFPVASLSVLPGMFGYATAFATGGGSAFTIEMFEAEFGSGWMGPFTDEREITAMTWWQEPDSGLTWLATGGSDGLVRVKPLHEGPEPPFEDLGAPTLSVIRGLATRDGELIALDCCAILHALRDNAWERLPANEQPLIKARVLSEFEGQLAVSDGKRIDLLGEAGWNPLQPAPDFTVRDLAGTFVTGTPRDELIALSPSGVYYLDLDAAETAWQELEGMRFLPRLIAAGDELIDGGKGLVLLVDTTAEQTVSGGIRFERIEPEGLAAYRYHGEGHSPGAVLADLDNDGAPDLYLVREDAPNELWRNTGGNFVKALDAAGAGDPRHSTGAIVADYDGDGDLDLYVTNFLAQPVHPTLAELADADTGRNTLYRNLLVENGTLAFEDVTAATTVPDTPGQMQLGVGFGVDAASGDELLARSLTAGFGDYDHDGDLDLFVGTHAGAYDLIGGQRDLLYRNESDGTFTDVTLAAGVPGGDFIPGLQHYGASQASVFADFDNDAFLDLYVTDKMGVPMGLGEPPDHLYRNLGDGTFEDWRDPVDPNFGFVTGAAMGITAGDYDNDGDLDFYMTDGSQPDRFRVGLGMNDLYRNRLSEDAALSFEILPEGAPAAFSWGTTFLDADLDGDLDLWVNTSAGWLDFLYRNELQESGVAQFTDTAAGAGVAQATDDRAVLPGDIDGDGLLDVIVVSRDGGVTVFHNVTQTAGRHWLKVRVSPQPVGARIIAAADLDDDGEITAREIQTRDITAGGNTCASTAGLVAHFGLGQADRATLTVRLPGGGIVDLGEVLADRVVDVTP